MYKIFVVEDDHSLRSEIISLLQRYGYATVLTDNFRNVVSEIRAQKPDLVVLDINLPYLDGYCICRTLSRKEKIPVILVSARDSVMDQVFGIETGADDYIIKPFTYEIFVAKVKAVLRRVYEQNRPDWDNEIAGSGLILNKDNLSITYKGATLDLTKNEFSLLSILHKNNGKVVKRDELLSEIWKEGNFVDDNTLTVNITRIKAKLNILGIDKCIKTKRGLGYIYDSKAMEDEDAKENPI